MMKSAMITIEVLVSMLILFLVIATSFENIKFFNILSDKKVGYEDGYIVVLNIKEKYENSICKTSLKEEGVENNFTYTLICKKEKELNSYVKGIDENDQTGNIGNIIMTLYRVDLSIEKRKRKQNFSYYVTRWSKVSYE